MLMMPGYPTAPQPMPMRAQPAPQPQRVAPAPTQWQNAANPQTPQTVVRGVSANQPAKFVLPSPESLGISKSMSIPPAPAPQQATAVDWNQIQSRLDRLGILRYQKDRLATGNIQITLLLPTADPKMGQPVQAQADTEAAAVLNALQQAESLARR